MDRNYPISGQFVADIFFVTIFLIFMFFIVTLEGDIMEGDKLGSSFIAMIKHLIRYITTGRDSEGRNSAERKKFWEEYIKEQSMSTSERNGREMEMEIKKENEKGDE